MDYMTEDELFQCTRFTRPAVVNCWNLCATTFSDRQAVPADTQLLAALQFFSSGSFQWMVGRSCGLSSSSSSFPFIFQVDIRNLNYSELQ